jgi:hypothetical protein
VEELQQRVKEPLDQITPELMERVYRHWIERLDRKLTTNGNSIEGRFSRRWDPHLLSHDQKKSRVDASRKLLSLLGMYAEHNFEGIAPSDESWFQYSSDSHSRFAGSRESAVPKIRREISAQKTMFTILFTSKQLPVLKPRSKGAKFY